MRILIPTSESRREYDEAEAAHYRGERNERGWLKHIHCDGARFHVISWGLRRLSNGKEEGYSRCSEPDCEENHPEGIRNENPVNTKRSRKS